MTHSSAHANRNAGSGPNDSRTNTYTPPERGNAAASSEYVSAPHSTTTAPTTQARRKSGTSSIRCATLAGVRKMPLPIVEPTSTATALHKPRRRTSRSLETAHAEGSESISSRPLQPCPRHIPVAIRNAGTRALQPLDESGDIGTRRELHDHVDVIR